MPKLHHTAYKRNYKTYILGCIDIEGTVDPSDQEKIDHIFARFEKEYGYMIDRVGPLIAMTNWLQGMALPIVDGYNDIVELAIRLGSIDPNPSAKRRLLVELNYWRFMANIILNFKRSN